MVEPRPWWTIEQVATTLQVNPETVRRWIRSGRLKGSMPGGNRIGYRIARADLESFVAHWYGKPLGETDMGQHEAAA